MRVDLEPGEGAEAARLHLHRVERALFDRRHARIGLLRRIALFAVVRRRAATEQRVFAVPGMAEILRQARNERRFPGEGDCDLSGLLRCLPANLPLSLEIPTVKLLEQGVSGLQRAQMAIDRTRELLARL